MSGQGTIIPTGERAQYLCSACWFVFEGPDPVSCPNYDEGLRAYVCGARRPVGGWPTLPYPIRPYLLLQKKLTDGGMGAVFLAYQTVHRRASVVKVVQQLGPDETKQALLNLFNNEVAMTGAMSALSTKHYVQYLDSELTGANREIPPFLELEYVRLPTLHTWFHAVRNGRLSDLEIVRIGIALAECLVDMHRQNYVHRDLKLSNLFIDAKFPAPAIKTFDFGLTIRGGADPERTSFRALYPSPTHIPGSEEFMSPEQMARQKLWPESDIHSVGSILWYLACRAVPFPASHGRNQEERLKERRAAVKTTPGRPQSMDLRLYRILAEALAFESARRFPAPKGGDPREHTPAMGLARALRRIESEMVAERRQAREANRKRLGELVPRVESIFGRVAATIELANRVEGVRGALASLLESMDADQHGDPAGNEQIDALEHDVDLLEQQVFEPAPDGKPTPRPTGRMAASPAPWRTALPWIVATLATVFGGYSFISRPDSRPPEVIQPKPPEPTPPAPDPNEVAAKPQKPVEDPDTTASAEPTSPPKPEPEIVAPAKARPCPDLTVTLRFDMPINVRIDGKRTDENVKQTTVLLPPNGKEFKVEFDDGGMGLCRSEKPILFRYDDLIERNSDGACTVKEPPVILASKSCIGAE